MDLRIGVSASTYMSSNY